MRHYSPDITSYLFRGQTDKDIGKSIFLDFGKTHAELKEVAKHYYDLSEESDFLVAIHRVYDALRWAETNTDAEYVLITDIAHYKDRYNKDSNGFEHLEALFDRLFRATSGQQA